jgi:hypothetical protein
LIGVAAWTISARRAAIGSRLAAALAIVGIGALIPSTWDAWSHEEFPRSRAAQYKAWKDVIAPGDDVFWGESPLSVWVLLNRPNYISGLQTSGMIFSRAAAVELQRRALTLSGAVGPPTFMSWAYTGAHLALSPDQLKGICRLQSFNYLVTNADLGMQPVAELDKLKLYRCAPQARAAAAAT